MKNRIVIDPEVLSGLASQLKKLSGSLQDCQQRVSRIHLTADTGANVSLHSSAKLEFTGYQLRAQNVRQQLEGTKTALKKISGETEDLAKAITKAKDVFEENERQTVNLFDGAGSPSDAGWSDGCTPNPTPNTFDFDVGGFVTPGISTIPNLLDFNVNGSVSLEENKDGSSFSIGVGVTEEKLDPVVHLFNTKDKDKLLKMDDLKRKHWENGKEVPTEEGMDADAFDGRFAIASVGAKYGYSHSDLSFDYSTTSPDGKYTMDTTIEAGKFEVEASGEAGLYSTVVGKDGKTHRVLSPGAEGHFGVSYTLLDAEVSKEYELIDGISLKSTTSVAVGKGDLSGDVKLGIVDGQFAAYGSLKAEVLAFEATKKFSADVFGAEASVAASATFGIGAHAKAGYHDGVIVFDVGAAMGLGATIKGEIDVGGFVENVADGLVKNSEAIANTVENVVDGTAKLVDNVGKGAKKIASNVCESIFNLF